MAARAMWKGVLRFGEVAVPIKLYSAIEDRDVHFRMLHRKDNEPVTQRMVNPMTDEVVPYEETQRAWVSEEGDLVMLDPEELEQLKPEPSRDVEVIRFLPRAAIDHRWFDRPYYLGPDGSEGRYFALAQALGDSQQEGLVRWTMRNKDYVGSLGIQQGHPVLMSLRFAEEVVPLEALEPPGGKALDAKELKMARQLIGMLAAEFDPAEWNDEYRERVLQLLETKAKGGSIKVTPFRRRKSSEDELGRALEASLEAARSA